MEPLSLPLNIVNTINLVLIGMLIVLALVGYLRGFIAQIYDWLIIGIGIFIGLLLAPSLASTLSLMPSNVNFDQIPFVGASLVNVLDRLLWIILIAIVLFIVGLIFKGLIIKKLLHYNKKVLIDRIGGAVFAILPVAFVCFLGAVILSLPLFNNGSEIISKTVLSPFGSVSANLVSKVISDNPVVSLYSKISNGEPLGEAEFTVIESTLEKMDFPQDVVTVAMKFVRQETVSEADISVLKTYAEEENITKETVMEWMKELGFSDDQIDEMMKGY